MSDQSEFEKWLEAGEQEIKTPGAEAWKNGFYCGATAARDWILDYCMRNARESITDQEYLFIDDLRKACK